MVQGRRAPRRVALAPGYLLAAPLALPLPAPSALGTNAPLAPGRTRLRRWGERAFGAGANAPSALGRTRLQRFAQKSALSTVERCVWQDCRWDWFQET